LDFNKMVATQKFTRPPARYTEASLVKKLEELGIGRPSTYAPTIATIQKRQYVVKENRDGVERAYRVITLENNAVNKETATERTGGGNKLYPTDMGMVVNDFLVEHFGGVLDYDFTAKIESDFDKIANGSVQWNSMIDDFYKPFKKQVDVTIETAERATGERALGTDPKTGKDVIARLGRYGPMVQIGKNDDEKNEKAQYAKIRPPFNITNITLEQAMEMFKLPRLVGSFEDKEIKSSEGRFGPYVVHDGLFASIPKDAEYDVFSITLDTAIELIKEKRIKEEAKKVKIFEEDEDIRILMGRWGAYIKRGKDNIPLPKEKRDREIAETLSFEEVMEYVAKAPEKKKKPAAKKKTAAKKTTKKKTTAKKTTKKK